MADFPRKLCNLCNFGQISLSFQFTPACSLVDNLTIESVLLLAFWYRTFSTINEVIARHQFICYDKYKGTFKEC